ncbi:ATP-binding protein [Alteromonas sp. C1M14]|uniref:sensor histidine kinase n=1 Tax=Alteromonas sp. C1M14 TaxID=2841567 RepID=UPI001C0995A1|nr:ATP-binding protein [Alteromonas sp. C1M14]MBU2977278.1 GHKL domain-containing protein [Alteromonas sp. C1M14]
MTAPNQDKIIQGLTMQSAHKDRLIAALRQDLQEVQRQLLQAEKMASIGEITAGVAHEINNPVGFVSSNLSTLSSYIQAYQTVISTLIDSANTPNAPPLTNVSLQALIEQHDIPFICEDIVSLIAESSEGLARVGEIINGLRLFSRIDSGERQWCDINGCMQTTLSMVNNQLKYICEQQLHLDDVPQVFINEGKVTQIFTNLLINAGQAIEETSKQGLITITTKHDETHVFVHITDTGIGIKREHIDKVFNPYFTTKPEGKGTGLGLSISQSLAAEHGGTLSVTSTENKGSTFTLSLPITAPPTESPLSEPNT